LYDKFVKTPLKVRRDISICDNITSRWDKLSQGGENSNIQRGGIEMIIERGLI
tara:strand:+ start:818 stop:976 length:159 start_codon:yes stop_codon:yes gene_type:complete